MRKTSEGDVLAYDLRIMSEPRLIGEKHLKMHVRGPAEPKLETIWWNRVETEQTVAVTKRHHNGIYDRQCFTG